MVLGIDGALIERWASEWLIDYSLLWALRSWFVCVGQHPDSSTGWCTHNFSLQGLFLLGHGRQINFLTWRLSVPELPVSTIRAEGKGPVYFTVLGISSSA
jgi:hypothetical protein